MRTNMAASFLSNGRAHPTGEVLRSGRPPTRASVGNESDVGGRQGEAVGSGPTEGEGTHMKVDAEAAGLNASRLARIDDHLQRRYIEPGKIAGCQVAVARKGAVAYYSSFGLRDRERGLP